MTQPDVSVIRDLLIREIEHAMQRAVEIERDGHSFVRRIEKRVLATQEAVDAILAALRTAGTGRAEAGALVATGWLASMGREDGEDRGPVIRFVMDASRDHAMKFANIWDGGTYEIRALPAQTAGGAA